MELWPILLILLAAAVAAVVLHGAAKAKRASDLILHQYEAMLREVRGQQSAPDAPPETPRSA